MKDKDMKLTVGELETLCNLYIECRLSVLEETELYYVLLKTDKDSALIRETLAIMGTEQKMAASEPITVPNKLYYRRFAFYGAAAIVLGIILSVFLYTFKNKPVEQFPVLSQNPDGRTTSESLAQKTSYSEFTPEFNNESKNYKGHDKSVTQKKDMKSDSKINTEHPAEMPENESIVNEGYIEIEDEYEVGIILQNVDNKITAILEKGINAQNKMPDIDEKINNILNKI